MLFERRPYEIIEIFTRLLESKNIQIEDYADIPDEDTPAIYGFTYGDLNDEISEFLKEDINKGIKASEKSVKESLMEQFAPYFTKDGDKLAKVAEETTKIVLDIVEFQLRDINVDTGIKVGKWSNGD
jgi:predicted Ser/Thr protein kinase